MGDPTSPFRSLLARVQRAQRDVRGGLTDEQRLYLINHAVQRASRGHLGARKLVAEMRVAIPALRPLLDHLAAQRLEMKNPFNVDTLVMQQFFET
jgi:hypothetical protein